MTNENTCPRAIDTLRERFEEKTRAAENAANTLSKLNVVMRQTREWRGDKAKLQSKIWRLKLALRSMGKDHDDDPQTDPLIEHQREEIRELEVANSVLENEVVGLKSALAEAEEDFARAAAWKLRNAVMGVREKFCAERKRLNGEIQYLRKRLREAEDERSDSALSRLRRKLREFAEGDRTMETIVADVASKVAETVANLSEELVNVSEDLYRSESTNEERCFEIDRLRAMLRSRCGNEAEYRKRASELKNLTMRLKGETDRLRSVVNNEKETSSAYEVVKNVEILMNELQFKLRNDREALLAGGNPACLKYVEKIVELRVNLRRLRSEVEKSDYQIQKLSNESTEGKDECSKGASFLEEALKQLDAEMDRLKIKPVTNHRGIVDGLTFLKKVEKLERTVEQSKTAIAELKVDSITVQQSPRRVDKLEDLVNDLCGEIKEIETYVPLDETSVFEIVKQLEESIVQLKVDAVQKDESILLFQRQLAVMKSVVEQKNTEMKSAQEKIAKVMADYNSVQENGKRQESLITELLREREDLKARSAEMQRTKTDFEDTRKKLQNLQKDRETLLKEMEKMRSTVTEKNEQIVKAIMEKDSSGKVLRTEINNLSVKLAAALDDCSKLKRDEEKRTRSARPVRFENDGNDDAQCRSLIDARNELNKLKIELNDANAHLEEANVKMVDLRTRLNKMTDDRSRLEANIFNLISCKEVLRCQLDAERIASQEKARALKRLSSENEGLRTSLDKSKIESDSLRASIDELNSKCSALESQVDSFKTSREALEREIRYLQTNSEDLKSALAKSQANSKIAEDEMARLKSENLRLINDLPPPVTAGGNSDGDRHLKGNEVMRVQLAERNEPVVRDQLNKANVGDNECLGVELNKSAHANERAMSKSATCRTDVTDDASAGRKSDMRAEHVEYRESSNEIRGSKVADRITDDQLQSESDEWPSRNDRESGKTKFGTKYGTRYGTKYGSKCEAGRFSAECGSLKGESANLRNEKCETSPALSRIKLQSENLSTRHGDCIDPTEVKIDDDSFTWEYEERTPIKSIVQRKRTLSAINTTNAEYIVSRDTSVEEDTIRMNESSVERLTVENSGLKEKIDNLRKSVIVSSEKYQKTRTDLRNAAKEMKALKFELNRLRDERNGLIMRLNVDRGKLERLRDEKIALKNELVNIRDANSTLRVQLNDLRIFREKLMQLNIEMKDRLMNAFREVNKYTMAAERLDGFECKLKCVFQEYVSAGDYGFNDHSRMSTAETDIQHMEGQRPHVAN